MLSKVVFSVRSIRVFAKNMGDPYYEPTIVVHDTTSVCVCFFNMMWCAHLLYKEDNHCDKCQRENSSISK